MPDDDHQRRQPQESAGEPLKSLEAMLQAELATAANELRRPTPGLLMSALSAGLGVGVSLLLIAALKSADDGSVPQVLMMLLSASAYAVGFVIVILGRMDLFTEFTTIAILPVLEGEAKLRSLARFWIAVYLGNLIGAALFTLLAVTIAPPLDVATPQSFVSIAEDLVQRSWWVMLLSAVLAGWLMGLLSWLIAGGRDTTSQILFVWLIAGTIGIAHLHHCIVGTAEVLGGVLSGEGNVGWGDFASFLWWATLGNVVGGVLFAVSVDVGQGLRKKR